MSNSKIRSPTNSASEATAPTTVPAALFQVMTLEFIPNPDRVSPPMAATFSFTMLGTTPAGDAYTFAEYEQMWRQVGLNRHELLEVPNSPQHLVVSRH